MADETKEVKDTEGQAPEETKEEVATTDEASEEKKEEATEPVAPEKKEEEAKEETPAEDSSEAEVEVPEKFQKIVEEIEQMPVLELNELVKVFENKFGVSATAVAAAPGGGEGGDAAEEKSSFNVELTSAGDKKIQVIKAVKNALGLGLKDAKDMVESAPAVLKEDVPKEEAEEMKAAVEEAGGSIELK